MRIEIQLFAGARQRAGQPRVAVELPAVATVADLKVALAETCPALAPLIPVLLIALNADYAGDTDRVEEGAEVAAFPPVSGGSGLDDRPAQRRSPG